MKKNNSFKKTLVLIYVLIIISLILSNAFSYITFQKLKNDMSSTMDSMYNIKDLIQLNKQLDSSLSEYAFTRNTIYIKYIYDNYQELLNKIDTYQHTIYDEEAAIYMSDIKVILENEYKSLIETTIASVRGVDEEKIGKNYFRSKKVSKYINTYLNMVLNSELEYSRKEQAYLEDKISVIIQRVILVLVLNFSLILFVGISYGRNLVSNISKLTTVAEEVSKGNFEVERINLNSKDETLILAKAFNKLISNTKRLIKKIKENAELEVKLHKEELEKSKMEILLKEAKLKGLQSQINPHFLFNTLNIVSKMAILEDADDTADLINIVSDMFRYNLGQLDKKVSVQEELNNVKNYIYIQKKRFGKRVEVEISVDSDVLNKTIPFLTLQPIVENAFIHGISELEEGGKIDIYSKKEEGTIYLVVEDNGNGMTEDEIDQLLNNDTNEGHSTGIGFNNVQQRLEYFHDEKNVLFIRSIKNVGTKVLIKISTVE